VYVFSLYSLVSSRYPLLLKEIAKNTFGKEQKEDITEALSLMKVMVEKINRKREEMEVGKSKREIVEKIQGVEKEEIEGKKNYSY